MRVLQPPSRESMEKDIKERHQNDIEVLAREIYINNPENVQWCFNKAKAFYAEAVKQRRKS